MTGRVLVVSNDFPPRTGGIESFVLAMARRLPPDQVVVHTRRQLGDVAFDRTLPFPVIRDPAPVLLPSLQVARRVAGTARRFGCDRVWFGAAAPLGLLAPALRRVGVRRTVATTHGHEVWWARVPGARALLRRIGDVNDVVTYLGEFCRGQIAPALSPAAAGRMRQLSAGVDGTVFRPGAGGAQIRRRFGLEGRPVIVCVSRFVPRKGHDVLLRALPAIRARVPGAALLLVGDGPYRQRMQVLAVRLGLAGHVRFTGPVSWAQTPAYYDAGDVFCLPTRTRRAGLEPEALGICFLEAAATGLPVVVGDSGGAPDAVLDGVTGALVDGRDPAAVADRCSELLLDRALAARYGRAGRDWVLRDWSWDNHARTLLDLLTGAEAEAGADPLAVLGPPLGAGGPTAHDTSTSPATSQYWL